MNKWSEGKLKIEIKCVLDMNDHELTGVQEYIAYLPIRIDWIEITLYHFIYIDLFYVLSRARIAHQCILWFTRSKCVMSVISQIISFKTTISLTRFTFMCKPRITSTLR